jgi:hypothetical protein
VMIIWVYMHIIRSVEDNAGTAIDSIKKLDDINRKAEQQRKEDASRF